MKLGLVFWPVTAFAKTCESPERVHLNRVSQIACQDACLEAGDSCLGISCSSSDEYDPYDCVGTCYLCKNENIVEGDAGSDVFVERTGEPPFKPSLYLIF